MSNDGFHTTRLNLEPLTAEHVDDLVALDSDPEVMRYLTGGRPSSRDEVQSLIAQTLGARWRACSRQTGEFVGWFGLDAQHGGENGKYSEVL